MILLWDKSDYKQYLDAFWVATSQPVANKSDERIASEESQGQGESQPFGCGDAP